MVQRDLEPALEPRLLHQRLRLGHVLLERQVGQRRREALRQERLVRLFDVRRDVLGDHGVVDRPLDRLAHLRLGQVRRSSGSSPGTSGSPCWPRPACSPGPPASCLICSGLRSRAISTSPFCSARSCALGSGRCRISSRFSFGAPGLFGFASSATDSLARHARNAQGPDPALFCFSQPLPKSPPCTCAMTVFLSTIPPTLADRQ